MITTDKTTEIFYLVDEFCKEFNSLTKNRTIGNCSKRPPKMSLSEVITIMILFHLGSFRNMKHFYMYYVQKHMRQDFPSTVSYNRFVELMQSALLPMTIFLKINCLGNCTGISFVDSTSIKVCNNKRIKRNKVFKGLAEVGKTTVGYFYGFKLHLIINDKGEVINFVITQGNVDDRQPIKNKSFVAKVFGKLYADKGYISKALTQLLFVDGIHLVTGIRSNMKNCLLTMKDKIMLRKRAIIETINDELKNICQIEHSRHRSFTNFLSNMISGIIAYTFFPKKPAIKYETIKTNQIALFY